MSSEAKQNSVTSSLTNWLDAYGRYIQYGVYGVGITGLLLMGRSIRVGSQFTEAKQIPKEFYFKNFTLYGKVRKVCSTGGGPSTTAERHVFLIQHNPIMGLISRPASFLQSSPSLPSLVRVQVPGLHIHNVSMVQVDKAFNNKSVRFTLLNYDETYETAVSLVHVKNFMFYQNLGAWCIRNRHGSLAAIENNTFFNLEKFGKYYNELAREEEKLNKTESRMWRRVLQVLQRKR